MPIIRPLLCAVIPLALACQQPNSSEPSEPSPPSEKVADRMLDHFMALTALERAVVRGDLIGAKTHAKALAKPRKGDPKTWAKRVGELQSAAQSATKATELPVAAGHVVGALTACAGCHRDLSVELRPVSIPKAPGGDTVAAKMLRHQWGMDLLRVAVVFEDDGVWTQGSDILTLAPLHPSEIAESGIIDPETIAYANRLRELARTAKARKQGERIELYGQLLQTCVGCHAE